MESTIALKLKALNYSAEYASMINLFMIDLSDELISLEELIQIINLLNEKGIVITKPSEQKIVDNGFLVVKKRIEEMELLGELDAYIEDPLRINVKGAAERIRYLQSVDEPYKTPEGKYSSVPFSKEKFEAKYGIVDLKSIKLDNQEIKAEQISIEPFEEHKSELEIEAVQIEPLASDKTPSDLFKEELEAQMQEALNDTATTITEDISDKIIYFPNVTVSLDEEKSQESGIDSKAEEPKVLVDEVNPIEEILNKPQTIGLNDEMFDRYEKLSDNITHVLMSVYGVNEVNDSITDNLIKLVTNEITDDRQVLYLAITYGKTVTEDEQTRIRSAIEEELEYTNIMDIDLGRAA